MAAAKTLMGVTAVALATHLDLTKQRIGQLADEGVLPRLTDGSYDLDDSRLVYIRWLRSEDRRATQSAANNRVRDARAREIELRIAKEERELVPVADMVDVIDRYALAVTTALKNIPVRASRDPAERARLQPFIDEARTAIATEMSKAAQEARTGLPPSAALPAPSRAARRRAARNGGG